MGNVLLRQVSGPIALPILGTAGLLLYYGDFSNKLALISIFIVTLMLFSVFLISCFDNIIIASRLLLIYVVGAYPLAVKLINEGYYYSVFEFNTQSLDITIIMYALTLIALPGCYYGWVIGQKSKIESVTIDLKERFYFPWIYYKSIFYFCSFVALLCGYLIVDSSTGTIFESAYGTGTEGQPAIGAASAIGGTAVSIMLYCALKLQRKSLIILTGLVAGYLFIWCQVLRGLRQDVVGGVFSLLVIYLIVKQKDIAFKFKYLLYLIPLGILLELWGLVRSGLYAWLKGEIDFGSVIDMGLGNAASVDGTIYSGTLGPITTTFSNTVYLIKENALGVIFGRGYFDYLLRTPPEFMFPDRPKDYALIFNDFGLSSGGGFFELAEAYLNFGVLGAALMPLIISAFISTLYIKAKKEVHIFYVFGLSSLLCVWLRGAWYQTFAFYKSFIASCLVFCFAHLLAVFIVSIQQGLMRNVAASR